MKRRTFLLAGLGTGGALIFGWALLPPRQRLLGQTPPDTAPGAVALNGWVVIAPDDTVTVVVPKAEMGQGIHTGLAMLMAEELGCRWDQVRVEHSPVDAIYGNIAAMVDGLPFHPDNTGPMVRGIKWLTAKTMREMGIMMTGGSSSLRDCWMPMREAGASARTALVAAAAARWGVDAAACQVADGVVTHGTQRATFGALAADALHHRPSRVTLKDAAHFTLLGKPMPRLEAPDKVRGAATYGIDVRIPGMRFAAVAMCPTPHGRVTSYDRAAAMAVPGVQHVIALEGSTHGDAPAIAVVADSWWRAQRGVTALKATWDSASPAGDVSSEAVLAACRKLVAEDGGMTFRSVGDTEDALEQAARVLDVTYEAPFLAHATMEPMNATVRVTADGVEVWAGTQVPAFARKAAARVAGVNEAQVTLHQQLLGGGFGRRLEVDYIAQATAIAKAVPGVPVQLIWSREDDMRHDMYRPAAVSRLRAALDGSGRVTAMIAHSAGPAPFKQYSRRVGLQITSAGPDKTTAEGTWDQPYEFPALRSTHTEVSSQIRVGSWRAVGHSHQAFFVESFIDEMAAAAQQDPAAFRRALLTQHPRARAVLDLVIAKSGWGTPLGPAPDGAPRARGIALHHSFSTIVAEVAEVSIGPAQDIRVHRVVAAVDCGFVVNPSLVAQQVESSIIYGLSAALHGAITVKLGATMQGNFHDYPPLRLPQSPVIETHCVPSMDTPSGIGEPALPPIAPAVANAVYVLTGSRLRTLPLRLSGERMT